jgi:predicted nucleic acid-binding protein
MTVYFDSSALVAVYVTEAYSERARRELRKRGAVPWTPLHDLEVSARKTGAERPRDCWYSAPRN